MALGQQGTPQKLQKEDSTCQLQIHHMAACIFSRMGLRGFPAKSLESPARIPPSYSSWQLTKRPVQSVLVCPHEVSYNFHFQKENIKIEVIKCFSNFSATINFVEMNNNDWQGRHKTSTLPTDVSNFHAFSKMYKSQKTITYLQNPNATPETSSFQIIKIHWWTYPFLLKTRYQNMPQMLCSMLNGRKKKHPRGTSTCNEVGKKCHSTTLNIGQFSPLPMRTSTCFLYVFSSSKQTLRACLCCFRPHCDGKGRGVCLN